MKRGLGKTCLLLFLLAFYPYSFAFSAPIEIIFFPQGAWVKEVKKIKVERGEVIKTSILHLPPQADPQSLRLALKNVPRSRIVDIFWEEKDLPLDDKIKNLQQKIEDIKKNKTLIVARLKAVETQLLFWQTQAKGKTKTIMDAINTSVTLGRNVRNLTMEKISLEKELGKLEGELGEAEREWENYRKRKERGWEVTVFWEGDNVKEVTFVYSYLLRGGGWNSFLRLEAIPKEHAINVSWEGEIYQPTREDWKDVNIRLADLPFSVSQMPPSFSAKGLQKTVPGEINILEIGKKDVPAGQKVRFKLKEEKLPVEFAYLTRPSLTGEVFLRGTLKSPLPYKGMTGKVLFVREGTVIGKGNLSALEKDTLFFGGDPEIRVISTSVTSGSTKSRRMIKITNEKSYPINITVEEPLYGAPDEKSKGPFPATPPPNSVGEDVVTWHLTLKAGEEKTIFIEK
ncbi:MAG: DUF4139 domain-containing protein [Syntrophales bacterium]|nr:DUF4139 domain-containing protein [Syntrophales bacterium]